MGRLMHGRSSANKPTTCVAAAAPAAQAYWMNKQACTCVMQWVLRDQELRAGCEYLRKHHSQLCSAAPQRPVKATPTVFERFFDVSIRKTLTRELTADISTWRRATKIGEPPVGALPSKITPRKRPRRVHWRSRALQRFGNKRRPPKVLSSPIKVLSSQDY